MPSTLRADRRTGNLGIWDGVLPAMNLLPVNRFFKKPVLFLWALMLIDRAYT